MNFGRERIWIWNKKVPPNYGYVPRIEFEKEEAHCKDNQPPLEIIQEMFCDHSKSNCYEVREA